MGGNNDVLRLINLIFQPDQLLFQTSIMYQIYPKELCTLNL